MKELGYLCAKVKYRLTGHNKKMISDYFRKNGMTIGENCNICCNIMTPEPYLLTIGSDVTIASDVKFITHDNSIERIEGSKPNLFGFINIGNNCFLGERCTVMYGVTLANNIIVAAGSVVCNSFSEERIIIGGNPARKIGTWDSLAKKSVYAMTTTEGKLFSKSKPEMFVTKKDKSNE